MPCSTVPTTLTPLQETGLLRRNRDERRFGIARPQPHLGVARRVVQRLDDRRGGEPRERQRHRKRRRLVVNDVELAGALDGGGEIQHLVELPRPHRRVVPVALVEGGVQPGAGRRPGRGEQRDVMAPGHEPLGEQRCHRFDRPGLRRRNGRGDRGDVARSAAASNGRWRPMPRRDGSSGGCSHAHDEAVSSRRGSTRRASKWSCATSSAARAWRRVVAVDAIDGGHGVVDGREGEQPLAVRQMRGPAGVLHQRRPARRQIALRAIAEPAGSRRDVGVLGDAEFRLRAVNEVAVLPRRARDVHRVDGLPAVLPQQGLRPVDRELERLRRAGREIDELDELLILVAADIREAFNLPRHHARKVIARRRRCLPVVERHRLPRLVPGEGAGRYRGRGGADVRSEREQVIEPLEELDVPRLRLRDGELGEGRDPSR